MEVCSQKGASRVAFMQGHQPRDSLGNGRAGPEQWIMAKEDGSVSFWEPREDHKAQGLVPMTWNATVKTGRLPSEAVSG
jgi:hypothetical protein